MLVLFGSVQDFVQRERSSFLQALKHKKKIRNKSHRIEAKIISCRVPLVCNKSNTFNSNLLPQIVV